MDSDPNKPSERDLAFAKKANDYRLHQDVIRWSLLAGYAAFFAATVAVITRNEIAGNAALSISLSIVLFLIGTCYLVLLAIENWFYNLFADYVKETEDRLMCKREVRPLSHFAKDKGHVTNPFHPSFYFALVAVTLGNTFFIIISLNRFLDALSAGAVIILCKAIIFLLFFSVYLWFFHFIFKRWERIVYRRIIHPLQHLYDSVQKNGTAQP